MKHDTFLKKIPPLCLGIAALLTTACSQQAPEPTTTKSGKPNHIWSDQVGVLHEAQDVAKHANELQAIKDSRLQERKRGY